MSKGIDSSNKKEIHNQAAMAPSDERLCRLASSAIKQGQTKALRRYLAQGLDPNSNAYDGRKVQAFGNLMSHAIWHGSFECFKILVAAGAEVGTDEVAVAIDIKGNDPRYLQHMLDAGKFDPLGGPDHSISWVELASRSPSGAGALGVLMQEICERERDALNSSVAQAKEPRIRRSL